MDEVRYLGVFIIRSQSFKCSLEHAKKSFFRACNAIFGKIGRIATEDVTLHLFHSKCIPVLLYGLEAFALNKASLQSLDFSVNRFLMKLFKTSSIVIVNECRGMFGIKLPSSVLAERAVKLQHSMSRFGFVT